MARWQDRANCKGMDPALFHEEKPFNWPKKQLARAKAICATCPVAQDCLQFAIENQYLLGVWGGMTYNERLAYRKLKGEFIIRRNRSEMDHGTDSMYQREVRDKRLGKGAGPCEACRQAHNLRNQEMSRAREMA